MHQCQMGHSILIPVDEGTSLSSSAKGLAGRYAGALYALAEESGKIDAVVKDMNGVAELVSANQDMTYIPIKQTLTPQHLSTLLLSLMGL